MNDVITVHCTAAWVLDTLGVDLYTADLPEDDVEAALCVARIHDKLDPVLAQEGYGGATMAGIDSLHHQVTQERRIEVRFRHPNAAKPGAHKTFMTTMAYEQMAEVRDVMRGQSDASNLN